MKIDIKAFLEAQEEVSKAKGISDEDVLNALTEAVKAAYIRYLGGGAKDMPDPVVNCQIDVENKNEPISLSQIKIVRDEVEDDMLEIETEEANEGLDEPKYKDGDEYVIPADTDELTKVFTIAVKSSFRQKLAEAERSALYEIYKDHIGEMMNGTVERADDRSVSVNIGKTSVELSRHELIGDEFFRIGDPIKVYIQKVESAVAPEPGKKPRGPQIEATRSSEGFLKRLFEEEIHEIYDGTVVIKAIARKAGVRSKVAVSSNNEDVDPTGACIGQGGSRIQKIVSQLGNGKAKEKIDVIAYCDDLALFVAEASRPAQVLGVKLEEEDEYGKRHAYAIIHDGDFPLAMGKYRSNADLARKLTGVSIEYVEQSTAIEKGIEYTPIEELRLKEDNLKKEQARLRYLKKTQEEAAKKAAEEEAFRRHLEEEALAREKQEAEEQQKALEAAEKEAKKPTVAPIVPAEAPKTGAKPEEFPAEATNPALAALAAMKAAEEARSAASSSEAESTFVTEEEPKEELRKEVQTTTTLSDLEAQLEASKEKKTRPAKKGRPRKITEEEVKREVVKPVSNENAMPVYTEEELAKIEEEEAANGYEGDIESDEDIDQDYADYDQYYDDEK